MPFLQLISDETFRLEQENLEMFRKRACNFCHKTLSDIIYLPCGHLICCGQCSTSQLGKKCSKCEKVVNGLIKAVLTDFSVKCSSENQL